MFNFIIKYKSISLYVKTSSLSISEALVNQINDSDWNNNHDIEIEKFLNMHKKVLDNLKICKFKNKQDKQRQKIIEKFSENEDILKLRISLIL